MSIDDARADALARSLGPLTDPPSDDFDIDALLAYHRRELDAEGIARVEARLAVDPEARAFLADLDLPASPFLERWVRRRLVRRRGAAIAGASVALAAAAAVVLLALWPRPDPPPTFSVSHLRGVAVQSRSEGPDLSAGRWRLASEARLVITLAPDERLGDRALTAVAYVDRADGALDRAATQPTLGRGGAVVLKARAAALFGDRFGPRALYIALTHDPDAPPDAGQRAPTHPVDGSLRWHTLRFDYYASGPDQ